MTKREANELVQQIRIMTFQKTKGDDREFKIETHNYENLKQVCINISFSYENDIVAEEKQNDE